MRSLRFQILSAGFLFLASSSAQAAGSGAFRVETPDAAAFGKGSAFVGEANTPAAIYYNPSGITQIEEPTISIGTTFLRNETSYTVSGVTTDMDSKSSWIPHLYYAMPTGVDNLSIGLGASTYWGLSTEWAQGSFSQYVATTSSLMNQDYMLTAAYGLNEQWSLGVSLDYDISEANKKKDVFNGIGSDVSSHLKGDSKEFAYRLSTLYKVNDQHQFGFQYRSRIEHTYEGNVYLNNLTDDFNPLATIFGGSSFTTPVEVDYELPQSYVVGYSFRPNSKWTFNADVEWMDWDSVDNETINYTDPTLNIFQLAVLNTGNPTARNWDSVWSFALGAEYNWREDTRLRFGYYHHDSPIPQETFDTSIPDSESHGFTLGYGHDFDKGFTLDLAYSFLYYEDRNVDNSVGAPVASVDGTYEQYFNILTATVTKKF